MPCSKCQEINSDKARFCQKCGSSLYYPQPSFFSRNKSCFIGCSIILVLIILVILGIVGFFTFLVSLGTNSNTENQVVLSGSGEKKIAVLNIDGVIIEKEPARALGNFTEEFTSTRRVEKTLNDIRKDNNVSAVILRINSPGGSAAASEEIYQDILEFKKTTSLPVVAYFSDLSASGGYYVAMATDKIVANPANITGSIGVIISYLNLTSLADKYGVKNIVYKSGPYKDLTNEFREATEEEKEIMQSLVDDAYQVFVNAVSAGRKMPKEKVKEIGDGRIYSAEQAHSLGLVDAIGSFTDTVNLVKKLAGLKNAQVVEFGQPTFFDIFLGSALGKFNISLLPNLNSYFDNLNSPKILYLYQP